MKTKLDRGDTIIELMLAFAIFAMAIMGTFAIMNKGLAVSQQSLEVTLVREQMDAQAELVRYLSEKSSELWSGTDGIKDNFVVTGAVGSLSPSACPTAAEVEIAQGFFLATEATGGPYPIDDKITLHKIEDSNYQPATTYAKVDHETPIAQGIWLQIAEAEGGGAYDVYIHACWDSVGGGGRVATLGTIVRIYDRT